MSNEVLSTKVKSLGSWLGIKLEITLFGVTILKWEYPPQEKSQDI